MIEYKVKVYDDRTEWLNSSGQLHRENGPAMEYSDGSKSWWLNDVKLSEEDFNKKLNSCDGKMVEIDGRKYKLTEI